MKEIDWRVIGIFQIGKIEPDEQNSTRVCVLADNYIELYKDEEIFFWNYYANLKNPKNIQWGTGLYRFLFDEQVLLMMNDIVNIKKDKTEKNKAQKLMEQFARNAELDVNKLGEPRSLLQK